MHLECPHCRQSFVAATPVDAHPASGPPQMDCPGCQRPLIIPELIASQPLHAAPPISRDGGQIPILQSPNSPPVDRCFCCGRPVWDGGFVRREIYIGSSSGGGASWSIGSIHGSSWGNHHAG